jgi:ActR/RegA family two-component response regulator
MASDQPIEVLIVDDDRPWAEAVQEKLSDDVDFTFTPHVALSGDEARELLRRIPFQVAVVDLLLPQWQDGLGLLKEMKDRLPLVKTILITDSPGCRDVPIEAMVEARPDTFVAKNVTAGEIAKCVKEVKNAILRLVKEDTGDAYDEEGILRALDQWAYTHTGGTPVYICGGRPYSVEELRDHVRGKTEIGKAFSSAIRVQLLEELMKTPEDPRRVLEERLAELRHLL